MSNGSRRWELVRKALMGSQSRIDIPFTEPATPFHRGKMDNQKEEFESRGTTGIDTRSLDSTNPTLCRSLAFLNF